VTRIGLAASCFLLAVASTPLYAQTVDVKNAWVRSTVPAQTASGAFMEITSREAAQLVGVSTPAASSAEMHEMHMEGDVMKMRAVEKLALPAGKPVVLGPGGYHLMLLGLKHPLTRGSRVPLTLQIESAGGKRSTVGVSAEVRDATASH
jgi:copper(I)-binding protein